MKFVTFNDDGTETVREFPFGAAVTGNMYDELRLDIDDARRIMEMGYFTSPDFPSRGGALADYMLACLAIRCRIGNMNKPTPPPTRVIKEGVRIENLSEVTITITLSKPLRFRIWVGKQIIKMAAWIIGCGLNIKEEEENDNG